MQIMRESLRETILVSPKESHAGLLMQRGLYSWDKDDKSDKENLIGRLGNIEASKLYKKAYASWQNITSDKQRFAVTAAKIVGRLYTGLSSASALETGLTTHHTYGMPMLAGSSVKGAVASYAEKIGLPENVCQVLFGDEDTAGAIVWHDAWWIPNCKPFVGEIITTHHQEYYNNPQKTADEMENPMPNQQIACQGSFYFVVECDNKAWADFANRLLFEMLQNQGMDSKTASGYGYFTVDETEQNRLNAQRKEQAKKQAEEEKAVKLAAMPEHERLIAKWQSKLSEKEYNVSNQADTNLFNEMMVDFQAVCENSDWSAEQKKKIAETFSIKNLKAQQEKWISDKRVKSLKPLLAKLSGE